MSKKHSYEESGYQIIFDEDWQVIQLDESWFYKTVSGKGYKSMDFLAYHKDWGIALIELKNYTRYKAKPTKNEIEDIVLLKAEDSLHLIEIISKFYSRKKTFRLATRYRWIFKFLPSEWLFWRNIIDTYKEKRVIILGDITHSGKLK